MSVTMQCGLCGETFDSALNHNCRYKGEGLARTVQMLEEKANHPLQVLNTEHLSRRDLLASDQLRSMSMTDYNTLDDMVSDAYARADALIKASGKGSDG